MELLVISHTAPIEKAGLAGEKTHNYYIKAFAKQKDIHVRLITVCKSTDLNQLNLKRYGIKNFVLVEKQHKLILLKRKFFRMMNLIFNPNDKYASFVSRERQCFFINRMRQWKKEGYKPNCIILEFTHSILLIDKVQEIFPNVPIIGSSHDVNFEGSKRFFEFEKNKLIKFFRKRQFNNLQNKEVTALSKCDYIVVQNEKDVVTLKKQEILKNKKFLKIVPYYDSYADIERCSDGKTIIFFGSMGRKENYLSIIKFIEEVFLKLKNDIRLVIIGGNPPAVLTRYESEKIHITGFLSLEEVKQYFSICCCMVVPLILGSGIKVKILEAFSGGIPVITNDIGNEGIFARDGEQILLCNSSEEFLEVLSKINEEKNRLSQIGINGKKYVFTVFDLEESKKRYIDLVKQLSSVTKRS